MTTAVSYWAQQLLEERMRAGYYGEITFVFQNGCLVLVKQSQTLKPPEHSERART